MKSILMTLALKLLTVDGLCQLSARIISNLLFWASRKGGKAWDVAKNVISKINLWTSLFLQVYDDEEMSPEEEKLVAEAIKDQTKIDKIVDILRKPLTDETQEKTQK